MINIVSCTPVYIPHPTPPSNHDHVTVLTQQPLHTFLCTTSTASRYGQPRRGYLNFQPLIANHNKSWRDCVLEECVEGDGGVHCVSTLCGYQSTRPPTLPLYHL
mgnify:CR=1 FL=1